MTDILSRHTFNHIAFRAEKMPGNSYAPGNDFLNTAIDILVSEGYQLRSSLMSVVGTLWVFKHPSDKNDGAVIEFINDDPAVSRICISKDKKNIAEDLSLSDFIKQRLTARVDAMLAMEVQKAQNERIRAVEWKKNNPGSF